MDILEHAVRAYNLILVLVQVILDAAFGNVYVLGVLAAIGAAAVVAAILLYRRRAPRA